MTLGRPRVSPGLSLVVARSFLTQQEKIMRTVTILGTLAAIGLASAVSAAEVEVKMLNKGRSNRVKAYQRKIN
jgi:hypothetical protein